jgi:hypothetical protein
MFYSASWFVAIVLLFEIPVFTHHIRDMAQYPNVSTYVRLSFMVR